MTLQTVTPAEASRLLASGALLIDIREADERARTRIPGSRHVPLGALPERIATDEVPAVIFHCRSGMRTQGNGARLAQTTKLPAFTLEGGLDAWARAGLPVEADRRQPIEVMRQVQITAGALVLLGLLLGLLVAPAFLALSAFVGAGLVFAGASGWCGMAQALRRMPWNRRAAAA